MSGNMGGYLKLAAAMAIVGSSVVAGKYIIAEFPVFLSSFLRFFIAVSILFVILALRGDLRFRITPKEMFLLIFQTFMGVFLFNTCLLYGLKKTGAIESGIITSSTPAVVLLMAFLFLKEKIDKIKSISILLTIMGVAVINLNTNINGNESTVMGNLLVIAAVIGEAAYLVISKRTAILFSPLKGTFIISFLGFLMFMPFGIKEASDFEFSKVSLVGWGALLYYGIFVTIIAFTLWISGIRKIEAGRAGLFTSFIPVSSVLFSVILLNEKIEIIHYIGALFVIIGVLAGTTERRKNESIKNTDN